MERSPSIGKEEQEIRRKTVSKITRFLQETYGASESQLKQIPIQIESLINQKDNQVGDTYKSYALSTLKLLKVMFLLT